MVPDVEFSRADEEFSHKRTPFFFLAHKFPFAHMKFDNWRHITELWVAQYRKLRNGQMQFKLDEISISRRRTAEKMQSRAVIFFFKEIKNIY